MKCYLRESATGRMPKIWPGSSEDEVIEKAQEIANDVGEPVAIILSPVLYEIEDGEDDAEFFLSLAEEVYPDEIVWRVMAPRR